MSEYDEEQLEPMPEPNRAPIKIAVETEIHFGEVLDRIAMQAMNAFGREYSGEGRNRIARVIDGVITKAVQARIAAAVDGLVDSTVERLLTDGWTEVGQYGQVNTPVTLEYLVRKRLSEKTRQSYDRPESNLIERKVDEAIAANMTAALTEEVNAARARFRKAVDSMIEAKVVEAARAALTGGR